MVSSHSNKTKSRKKTKQSVIIYLTRFLNKYAVITSTSKTRSSPRRGRGKGKPEGFEVTLGLESFVSYLHSCSYWNAPSSSPTQAFSRCLISSVQGSVWPWCLILRFNGKLERILPLKYLSVFAWESTLQGIFTDIVHTIKHRLKKGANHLLSQILLNWTDTTCPRKKADFFFKTSWSFLSTDVFKYICF